MSNYINPNVFFSMTLCTHHSYSDTTHRHTNKCTNTLMHTQHANMHIITHTHSYTHTRVHTHTHTHTPPTSIYKYTTNYSNLCNVNLPSCGYIV